MPSRESTQTQPAQPRRWLNASLYGAMWTRFLLLVLKVIPATVCVALTRPASFLVFLLAGSQRRAVHANLSALRHERSRWATWWDSYEVFRQYGLTYLDYLWHLHFGKRIDWEFAGDKVFEKLRSKESGGALVFTVHSGNYDIGASLFSQKLERPLHIVRIPEQSQCLNDLRTAELMEEERRHPYLRFHYNEPGDHLGMELCSLLAAGEVVAIQGDRIMRDISPTETTVDGVTYRIPRGPLVLAEVAKVPCYPIFVTRKNICAYHIEMGEPFLLGGQRMKADDIALSWASVMHRFLIKHWNQWFVFEELVTRNGDSKK